jgi:hypothetical protein
MEIWAANKIAMLFAVKVMYELYVIFRGSANVVCVEASLLMRSMPVTAISMRLRKALALSSPFSEGFGTYALRSRMDIAVTAYSPSGFRIGRLLSSTPRHTRTTAARVAALSASPSQTLPPIADSAGTSAPNAAARAGPRRATATP